jgi:glutaredoxin 3
MYRYTNIDLRNDPDGKAIRVELGNMIGRTSVPAIFINQQYIGGCNDGGPYNNGGGIVALQQSQQLDTLLQQAGAI